MKQGTLVLVFTILIFFGSCKKESISIGANVQDLFYLENRGAKMPILVEGNTASGVIIVWVHGGPGGTSIGFQNDEYITKYLESEYAVAYWDQRASGGSQGSFTPKLEFAHYVEDLKKVIILIKHRYGTNSKVFLLSHSWGGLIVPAFLTENDNQSMVKGWINVAGTHNYYLNDSLTREALIKFGNEQIAANIHKKEWEKIVKDAEESVPDYTLKTSTKLNLHANTTDRYIDDIETVPNSGLTQLLADKTGFSLLWALSNAVATQVSDLPKDIMYAEYSTKLHLIKLPLICITGKYDFVCPRGLADEVIRKTSSTKKRLVILPHSGHLCMIHEPDTYYKEILSFVKENL